MWSLAWSGSVTPVTCPGRDASPVETSRVRYVLRSTFYVRTFHVPIRSPLSTNGERINEWGRALSQWCLHPAPPSTATPEDYTMARATFARSTFARSHVRTFHVPRSTFPRSTFYVPIRSPLSTNGERINEWGRALSQWCLHPAPPSTATPEDYTMARATFARSTFARSHVRTFYVPTFPRSTFYVPAFPRSTFPRSHVRTCLCHPHCQRMENE